MEWPAYVRSPVDWDPAWNEWVGLPETPRSARPTLEAIIETDNAGRHSMVPDVLEYQQLVLVKVGDMERYRSTAEKSADPTSQQRADSVSRDTLTGLKARKPAAKTPRRSSMQQIRHAGALDYQPIVLQPPSHRQHVRSRKSEKHVALRGKGRVYGGSAAQRESEMGTGDC